MRIRMCVLALVIGLFFGYRLGARQPVPVSAGHPDAISTTAKVDDGPATSAAARTPVARKTDVATSAAVGSKAFTPLELPATRVVWSESQEALRRRAEGGDAAAAAEWLATDARCFAMQFFAADGALPSREFRRAFASRRGRFPQLITSDQAHLAQEGIGEAEVNVRLAGIQQRLLDECHGYAPDDPRVRYALGEMAARLGSAADFWSFIDAPPFAPQATRDLDQARDWSARAPRMLQERAASGDGQAAYVLGLAYALDAGTEWRGGGPRGRDMLNAAVANDPIQAYRWLSLFQLVGGDPAYSARAQELLGQLAIQLDAIQRADAERWAIAYQAAQFGLPRRR